MTARLTPLLVLCVVVAAWGSPSPLYSETADLQLLQKQQVIINELCDNVLQGLRQRILDAGKDTISIPGFEKKSGAFYIQGTEGFFQELSSVRRTADAVLSYGDEDVTLGAAFGLERLTAGYTVLAQRKGWLSPFKVKGHVKITAKSNSFGLKAGVELSGGKCMVAVNSVNVEDLSGLQAKATGFGIWSAVVQRLVNYNLDEQTIRNRVQEKISKLTAKFEVPCPDLPMLSNKTVFRP